MISEEPKNDLLAGYLAISIMYQVYSISNNVPVTSEATEKDESLLPKLELINNGFDYKQWV